VIRPEEGDHLKWCSATLNRDQLIMNSFDGMVLGLHFSPLFLLGIAHKKDLGNRSAAIGCG